MDLLTKEFWYDGLKYANFDSSNSISTGYRKFRTFYGVAPNVCSNLWRLIIEKPPCSEPKHLLWCLLFLKSYSKEHVNAAIVNVDEKTFRLWTWRFVNLLADLDVVKWENRLKNANGNMRVTLDGTDCRIREPQPFSKKWYSHKFKAAGIRYEVGILIEGAEIVWGNRGVPCGEWPDLKLAKELYLHFAKDEVTLADKGYRVAGKFKQPSNAREKRLLARHESLNGRLKEFSILSERFRHPLTKHPRVFHAVLNIVQVSIANGEQLFV